METQCNSSSPLDIEDIEDLFDLPNSDVTKTGANSSLVVPKVKKKVKKGIIIQNDQVKAPLGNNQEEEECFLPGQAKIYVKTWGCSHNVSDGEYMAGQLAAQGYTVLEEKNKVWCSNLQKSSNFSSYYKLCFQKRNLLKTRII